MMLVLGSRIGRYEIRAPLGAGGMGEVYVAHDPKLGRDVAIKVLPAAFSADADRLTRFEQEARAAGALNHPNVLALYDVGTDNGVPYIVAELLDGEPLRAKLGRPIAHRKALDYAAQIARGLAAAHERGIVHRDLKPENVLVTADGRAKIVDFGLAKLALPEESETSPDLLTRPAGTDPGVVLGTVGYMARNRCAGRGSTIGPTFSRSAASSMRCSRGAKRSGRRRASRRSTPFLRKTPRTGRVEPCARTRAPAADRAVSREEPGGTVPVRQRSRIRAGRVCRRTPASTRPER